jgi:hypothetical protein
VVSSDLVVLYIVRTFLQNYATELSQSKEDLNFSKSLSFNGLFTLLQSRRLANQKIWGMFAKVLQKTVSAIEEGFSHDG